MIMDFWVENYLSIRYRQHLSFEAKGSESECVAKMEDGTLLYKLAVLYGANASGKSNILYALQEIFKLLIVPLYNVNEKIIGCNPFALTGGDSTKMHISFYVEGAKYDYDVEFNKQHILREGLFYYPNGTKVRFYERSFVGADIQPNIIFGGSLSINKKTQDNIRANTLNNHSVLAVCNKNTFEEDIEPFMKLKNGIEKYYHDIDGDEADGIISEMKEICSNEQKKKKFYLEMLKKSDFNICDFRVVTEDRKVPQEVRNHILNSDIPEEQKKHLLNEIAENIEFTHNSKEGVFDVPLRLQSKGTRKFITILKFLYDLTHENHVYFVDELGEDLHPELLTYYLNVFMFNSERSQLIITSQVPSLLAEDFLNENRGLVWFVRKEEDKASSTYSRGDSYGLHKNLSFYNSYKIGRLGAKPELGSFFID